MIADTHPIVFEYRDYKKYLNRLIETYPNSGRGQRRLLAEAIRCQVAYVSHVLSGAYHFSPEQAEAASRFFGLSREESEYLVMLVAHNRADTPELRAFYDRILIERSNRRRQFKSRLKIDETLSKEDRARYYSHWYYAAIHMLMLIPQPWTRQAIADRLRLPKKRVIEALDFLLEKGIIEKKEGRFRTSQSLLHLEVDSPLVAQHHRNWRLQAMQAFERDEANAFHYSGAVVCAEKDLAKIQDKLMRCLQECIGMIRESKDEKLAILCMDWFEA